MEGLARPAETPLRLDPAGNQDALVSDRSKVTRTADAERVPKHRAGLRAARVVRGMDLGTGYDAAIWSGGHCPRDDDKRTLLVIQMDLFVERPLVTVAPVTSDVRDTPPFRLPLCSGASNALDGRYEATAKRAVGAVRHRAGGFCEAHALDPARSLT